MQNCPICGKRMTPDFDEMAVVNSSRGGDYYVTKFICKESHTQEQLDAYDKKFWPEGFPVAKKAETRDD